MKKVLKWGMIAFVSLTLFLWGLLELASYWGNRDDGTRIGTVTGISMIPTLRDGEKILINSQEKPKVGDIVSFWCNSEKCRGGHETLPSNVKFLKSMHDDCYWFEGDNKEESFDSRSYGELCGAEIIIDGVVHKLSNTSEQEIVVEPTDPTLVQEEIQEFEPEPVAPVEPVIVSAPSPQPVAVKAQPKKEKKKKAYEYDKDIEEIRELINRPSQLSQIKVPDLEITDIQKPSPYKAPDFHVEVKPSNGTYTGDPCDPISPVPASYRAAHCN